jgi:hypothetical protein
MDALAYPVRRSRRPNGSRVVPMHFRDIPSPPMGVIPTVTNVDIPVGGLRELKDGEEPQPGDILVIVLTPKWGDKRLVWNKWNLGEVAEMRQRFAELLNEGMIPYITEDGKKTGKIARSFKDIVSLGEVVFSDQPPSVVFVKPAPATAFYGG